MATTYSANLRLQKPSTSDRNWDVPINANVDAIDGLTAVGSLAVTPTEIPSATLQAGVSPGNYVKSDGTVASFAGAATVAVAASATTYLWLDASGNLVTGPAFPASAHLRLAHVIAGPSAVVQVVDERVQCSVAGQGLGFVLKSGDTMAGPLTIASGSGPSVLVADPAAGRLGFFGSGPAGPATALTPLACASGTATDSIGDVGASFSQGTLNNNFASVAAKVDALIAALKRHGLMAS